MIGIFFLPMLALRGKEVLFERRPLWHYTALMAVLCALFLLYENSHPFDRLAWFLRNRLLIYAAQTYVDRALFFAPVLLGLILVAHCMRRNLELTIALGLSTAYLAAHWLIEPRYGFIPLALLILLRRSEDIPTEIALLSWFALGASYLFVGTAFGWFFI